MKYASWRVAVAGTAVAYAMTAAATTQVSPDRAITGIGSYVGAGWVTFHPAIPNLEGCPYTAGDTVYFDWSTNPNVKMMYATAMAAYVAGQKVGFGVSGCYSNSAPLAYRVDVKP